MAKSTARGSDYLWHRPNTSAIWFSRAIPKAVRHIEGKRVIQFSLGTSDPVRAKALARKAAAELDDRWANITIATTALDDPRAVAHEIGFTNVLQKLDADRLAIPGDNIAAYEAQREHRKKERQLLGLRLNSGNTAIIDAIAARALANPNRNLGLTPGSDEYREFAKDIALWTIEALKLTERKLSGEFEPVPRREFVQQLETEDPRKAKAGETIIELFERWASDCLDKGEKRSDTIAQDRKVIEQFIEFVGKDRSIDSITAIEVAEYRGVLRDLPPKWRSHKALSKLSLRDAGTKARALAMAKSAFTSVNKHLSTISPLYKWLAKQPAWAGLKNPVDGLFHSKVRGKNRRPSLTTDQLNTILQSPLFTGFVADGKEHQPGSQHADDWRRWIPLICLFTGARIGEIAQLKVGDLRQERGRWFIHIRHDEAAGLTTKSGQSRSAPVHPILLRCGLLAFHKRQLERAGTDLGAPLFVGIEANARGQISGIPSRFWRDYLEDIGVKGGSDGIGAHSFRHTLADRLRSEAELIDSQVGIILGHSQPSTTSGYGGLSQGTVNMLSGWIDAVRFDGVDFTHLLI